MKYSFSNPMKPAFLLRSIMLLLTGAIFMVMVVGCGSKNMGSVAQRHDKDFANASPEIKTAWAEIASATKAKDYAKALIGVSEMTRMAAITPEQKAALEDIGKSVSDAMYEAANNGDADAERAVKQLKALNSR